MEINESLQDILSAEELVTRAFYETFLSRHPEMRVFFEGVDLDRQAVLLTMQLILLEQNYNHYNPATRKYLVQLGRRHQELGIATDAYPAFQECLLQTLKRHHADAWDETLERQWHSALDHAIEMMLEGYEPRDTSHTLPDSHTESA